MPSNASGGRAAPGTAKTSTWQSWRGFVVQNGASALGGEIIGGAQERAFKDSSRTELPNFSGVSCKVFS
jgi:hypothetical protein